MKIIELVEGIRWQLPPEPGTAPVPAGHVRLYHQTSAHNLGAIKHQGIRLDRAKGIEGPRAIYADEQGFYGKPYEVPTVEFHVPQEDYRRPFVHATMVPPENILAVHHPWHSHARYIENNPEQIADTLDGKHDHLLDDPEYGKALRYIKHKFGKLDAH